MIDHYLQGALLVLVACSLLWLVSVFRRDVSLIDIFWGPAFVLVVSFWFWRDENREWPQQLYLAMLALWGFRLAAHIGIRHQGEDYRYRTMRERQGPSFTWTSLVTVFLLQGLLVMVIVLPHLWIHLGDRPARLVTTDYLALALFAIGFFFEAVGDWQLSQFKGDPKNRGKVLRHGLWAYTRHPNYFGDATLWWGFFVGALASTHGWMTLPAVLLMNLLLLKVSGVSLLEKTIVERRPEYREYIESTSAFFPWWPKKRAT